MKAFDPKFSWLVTEPSTFVVFILCLSFAYATHILKEDGIVSMLGSSPYFVQDIVDKFFCCWYTFASRVQKLWFLTAAAHVLEGMFVAYQCKTQLKLPNKITFKWFILTCCVGFCMTGKIIEYVGMNRKFQSEKDAKKSD